MILRLVVGFGIFYSFSTIAAVAPKESATPVNTVVNTAKAVAKLPDPADSSWKKIGEEDSILTYSKDIEGASIVAFRGEAVIDSNIAKITNVLTDTTRKKEWVAKLVEAKDVKRLSEVEKVEYNHTSAGFPFVSDRDFVFKAAAELDRTNGRLIVRLKSVDEPSVPENTENVRGEITSGIYILTPIEGGTKTHLVLEISADPKGSIPKILVNSFQKHWPRKTIQGIRAQAAKADVGEYPLVRQVFGQELHLM